MEPKQVEKETAQSTFEAFCAQNGLTPEEAMQVLRLTVEKREQVMRRAREVMAAMQAIGDEEFTVESLRANPEAMKMVEDGMPVGEVYRRYFLKSAQPVQEKEANLGLEGLTQGGLTAEEIERISEYVGRTGKNVEI